jgi:hypothetical protein
MGKSSIHLQTAKGGTVLHNARENYSKSVVFTDEKNELWNDSKTAFKMFRDELEVRTKAYTERTGQKLHKTTSTMISGVVNLEQHHTLKDMEKIKDYLEKEFGTKVIQMSVHRDEGKLINKENQDLKLVSGKDFFLNAKDNKLYFDSKFENKINMNEWQIEKNYHGHFEMLGLDNEGKTLRKKMNIIKLSKLQDFTAQSLGMERTLSNVIVNEKGKAQRKSTTNKKRLDTHEFKEQAKIINETKKDLVSEKDLKKEILELKKELQEEKAKRPDYAKLENMNKLLLERVHEKNLTINDFKIEIDTYKKEREQLKKDIFHPTLKKSDDTPATNLEVANHYIKQNKSLKEQNKVLENKVITLEDKIVSSSPQNDLLIKEIKDLKEKVTVLENENKSLKQKIKDIVSLANEKIKSLFQFKIWNNYKHKQTKFDREYINENKEDFWEELVYDNPRVDTLYKDNIENELIKIDDFIPGEKKEIPNYSKMNLADILNSNKADLKEAQDNLKELLEKDKQETAAVNIRKLF